MSSQRSVGETLMLLGTWRLQRYDYEIHYYCIEHKCRLDPEDTKPHDIATPLARSAAPEGKGWRHYAWTIPYRGRACYFCQESAPEGLQACFWFLKKADPK